MWKRRLKRTAFAVGLVVLFFIIQFDFNENKTWTTWSMPLSGKVILIDPGHGGVDGGAGDRPMQEKDIALSISLKLRDFLQQQGAIVLMTRETDRDLAPTDMKGYSRRKAADLKERIKIINNSDADLVISIHLNAIPSSRWSGAQTFYNSKLKENAKAAKLIQKELRVNLENTTRKAKPLNDLFILKHSEKPGVLVEAGFLSNPTEKMNLERDSYQEMVAASIYKGIIRYYTK
ncbi:MULTISPECIES: N-acetylmuramoyl-L-alanine amidase CwlD [unclassified Bacillus (in: firmicutes)]|uniref:N-acetylmuramoyl-L-alanine amidase CwlD n=1 Tax=unclassified Bacillus (in: firmicutes) TaxID=185979 RepID=UPI000ACFC287|nr:MULTISPECIES: N-acetylmuramoyl-L-alanine amidase CwlD [unclassified Bacillus (in: firmicutes)]